jgi:WD40 repeat protein
MRTSCILAVLCCSQFAFGQAWESKGSKIALPTKEVACKSGHGSRVHTIRFSPDAELLATFPENNSGNQKAKIWSADGCTPVKELDTERGLQKGLAWANNFLAIADEHGVSYYDVGSWGKQKKVGAPWIGNPNRRGYGLDVYPKDLAYLGGKIYLANSDCRRPIISWNPDGKESTDCDSREYDPEKHSDVECMAISPDGGSIAIGTTGDAKDFQGAVVVYRVNSNGPVREMQAQSLVRCVAWSPDSELVVSAQGDDSVHKKSSVKVWAASSGEEKKSSYSHTKQVNATVWSRTNFIVSGSDDKTLRFYNEDLSELTKLELKSGITALDITEDGKILAVGLANGDLMIFKVP